MRDQCKSILLPLILLPFLACSFPLHASENAEDMEFRRRLTEMLERTETSIKVLREQIVESQHAPFLSDLYFQLAELLSEKANVLYYVRMEQQKNVSRSAPKEKFMPVVNAQQEAIRFYRMLLKDFPAFDKKRLVQFKFLATSRGGHWGTGDGVSSPLRSATRF